MRPPRKSFTQGKWCILWKPMRLRFVPVQLESYTRPKRPQFGDLFTPPPSDFLASKLAFRRKGKNSTEKDFDTRSPQSGKTHGRIFHRRPPQKTQTGCGIFGCSTKSLDGVKQKNIASHERTKNTHRTDRPWKVDFLRISSVGKMGVAQENL